MEEYRTRLVECPSFKGKVFGSNPNVFKKKDYKKGYAEKQRQQNIKGRKNNFFSDSSV